ncbi:MAG: TetR/AcrR family transcriptional regulator [Acidimicrobiales bacterium]
MGGSRRDRHDGFGGRDGFHKFRAHEERKDREAGEGRGLHRRSESARRAILHAADDLLVELGFGGVTVEGIAARAGVGKQTIYRWWRSKVDVLLDCLIEDTTNEIALPDTGKIDEDLRAWLKQIAKFLTRSDAGQVLRALVGEAQHDEQMARTLRTRFLRVSRERDQTLLIRGIERRELPEGMDLDAALDQLLGPVYYRVLMTGDKVDPKFTDGVVERFLAGVKRVHG